MPSQKISAMPNAAPLDGTELVPIVQSGVNKRTTTGAVSQAVLPQIKFYGLPDLALPFVASAVQFKGLHLVMQSNPTEGVPIPTYTPIFVEDFITGAVGLSLSGSSSGSAILAGTIPVVEEATYLVMADIIGRGIDVSNGPGSGAVNAFLTAGLTEDGSTFLSDTFRSVTSVIMDAANNPFTGFPIFAPWCCASISKIYTAPIGVTTLSVIVQMTSGISGVFASSAVLPGTGLRALRLL